LQKLKLLELFTNNQKKDYCEETKYLNTKFCGVEKILQRKK
jgi:hypothetical protein